MLIEVYSAEFAMLTVRPEIRLTLVWPSILSLVCSPLG